MSFRESFIHSLILIVLVIVLYIAIDMTPNNDLGIEISLFRAVSREQVVQTIKKDKEYISQEKEKDNKINKIRENSYFEKLKKSNILRENKTIDPSKRFDIIKFVKDGNVISNTIKSMSTKDLISNFSIMNDEDRISTILTIISRNEFKKEYIDQLESANTSILKEENKTKEEIEKIEKPFNEKFNQKVEKELQTLKKIRKCTIVVTISVILIIVYLFSGIVFMRKKI